MDLKIYADPLSQPSRAVFLFCRITKIPHQLIQMSIAETKTPEYAKINPARLVPAIVQPKTNFRLSESHAILRYLSKKYKTQQKWYPRDNIQRSAKIDEYLDYHHANTRRIAMILFSMIFAPTFGFKKPYNFNKKATAKQVKGAFDYFESILLKKSEQETGDQLYLIGNQISIADLVAYNEIIQLSVIQYDFSKRTVLSKWLKTIESIPEVKQQTEKLKASFGQWDIAQSLKSQIASMLD